MSLRGPRKTLFKGPPERDIETGTAGLGIHESMTCGGIWVPACPLKIRMLWLCTHCWGEKAAFLRDAWGVGWEEDFVIVYGQA